MIWKWALPIGQALGSQLRGSRSKTNILSCVGETTATTTEFYDGALLEKKIGNSFGMLLKVDACTTATLRGRYVGLCIQVTLEEPITTIILIGSHLQQIIYHGEGFLYKNCGRLGHTQTRYPHQMTGRLKLKDSIKDLPNS